MAGVDIDLHGVDRPIGKFGDCIREFERLLDNEAGENALHDHLARNPFILSQQLPHCHHVVSKPRLGSEYIPDFLLPEMHSGGTDWYLIELEPCDAKLVTASGQLAERVRGAIQQIKDWKTWLKNNLDYARRPLAQNGLGLEDMESTARAWIIVGRRAAVTERFNTLRNQVWENDRIQIMSYDRIVEWAKQRAEFWDGNDKMVSSLLGKIV